MNININNKDAEETDKSLSSSTTTTRNNGESAGVATASSSLDTAAPSSQSLSNESSKDSTCCAGCEKHEVEKIQHSSISVLRKNEITEEEEVDHINHHSTTVQHHSWEVEGEELEEKLDIDYHRKHHHHHDVRRSEFLSKIRATTTTTATATTTTTPTSCHDDDGDCKTGGTNNHNAPNDVTTVAESKQQSNDDDNSTQPGIEFVPGPGLLLTCSTMRDVAMLDDDSHDEQDQQQQQQQQQRNNEEEGGAAMMNNDVGGREENLRGTSMGTTIPTTIEAELAPNVEEMVAEALRQRRRISGRRGDYDDDDNDEAMALQDAEIIATIPTIITKENLILPKFTSDALEQRFQAEHSLLIRAIIPFAAPLEIFLVMVFYFWDIFQPSDADTVSSLLIRIVVSIILALQVPISKSRLFATTTWAAQPIMCAIFIAGTAGILLILYISSNGFVVGIAGVGACIMASSTLAVLRFRYNLLYCFAILTIANIMILYKYGDYDDDEGNSEDCYYDQNYVLINTNFFLVPFCAFGALFGYAMELHLRQRFRDTGTIFRWTKPRVTETYTAGDENEE